MSSIRVNGPHQGRPVLHGGAPFQVAKAAMILVHGRGADAEDILSMGEALGRKDVFLLAPQAADHSWLPHSFREPKQANEPYLSSALAVLEGLLSALAEFGFPPEKVVLGGFSQGACLVAHFAVLHPRRYGGLAVLSGGLIGDEVRSDDFSGSMQGTPVFLGCSDVDQHVPLERVRQSSEVFRRLGADVTERIYPGAGHSVNGDELGHLRAMLDRLVDELPSSEQAG